MKALSENLLSVAFIGHEEDQMNIIILKIHFIFSLRFWGMY